MPSAYGEPTAIRALPVAPRRMVQFSSSAAHALEVVLAPYQRTLPEYLRAIGLGRDASIWAAVFLDREYRLAGHVFATLPASSRIRFAPYARVPDPVPQSFVPGVGVFLISRKADLLAAASASPVFAEAWRVLGRCDVKRRWLCVLDPLPESAGGAAYRRDPALNGSDDGVVR